MHHGARHYQRTSDLAASPRAIEIAVFRETNKRMLEAQDEIARIRALNRNHTMWSTLVKDVGLSTNPLPPILKQDLTSVGMFAMQYSTIAISFGLPIEPLIQINENMIDGLVNQAPAAATQRPVAEGDREVAAMSA